MWAAKRAWGQRRGTVALWVKAVASMGPHELESFEHRTFAAWDRASLGDLRRAIERRRKALAGGASPTLATLTARGVHQPW